MAHGSAGFGLPIPSGGARPSVRPEFNLDRMIARVRSGEAFARETNVNAARPDVVTGETLAPLPPQISEPTTEQLVARARGPDGGQVRPERPATGAATSGAER